MNSRNTTKMVEHKLVLFSTVIALWTLITIIKAKLHTPKVEIHRRPKLFHFGCYMYVVRAKLFCLKKFCPCHWAGVFVWKNFHAGYLSCKNRDLSYWASLASHMNRSIFLQRKEWQSKFSNWASPVDRAHMKRPTENIKYSAFHDSDQNVGKSSPGPWKVALPVV